MTTDGPWARFWLFVSRASVRTKILGIVVVLILLFGLVTTFQVRGSLRTALTGELEKRGVAIASDLSARSTNLILTANILDLQLLIEDTVERNETVRYAFVLDKDGAVLAASFGDVLPIGLDEVNQEATSNGTLMETIDTDEGPVIDVAAPVFGGRAGTARIGMSTSLIREEVTAITERWVLITGAVLLVGLAASYWLASLLTRPIKHLVEATRAITRGDLKRKAPVGAPDEIGRLAMAFNSMTEYLANARADSERLQSELINRNVELAALNTIATELSNSRELETTIRRSLVKVAQCVGRQAGWVSLLSEDREQAVVVCHTGLSDEAARVLSTVDLAGCRCGQQVLKKSVGVVSSGDTDCAMVGQELIDGMPLRSHAIVPLISQSQVLGLLSVASSEQNGFTSRQLGLLSAIGHQIGVAVDNANLWEELRRREQMRGRLLEATISAQEAERRRIARELHDQTGQSLTSLMIGLRMLETNSNGQAGKKIAEMRQLTGQTLAGVHRLALDLRPSSLDDLGLISALEQYVKEYPDKYGVEADFHAIGFDNRRLLPRTEITIYRIVQEALTNVAKHASATKVSVLMEIRQASIVAIVEDNGHGFSVPGVLTSTSDEGKLGLHGMQERAALIDGLLTVESTPGAGTTVFAEIPLKGNELDWPE
ncbi:MAG: HAMP domain-containing protein [Dehalococcoidales bacterium]